MEKELFYHRTFGERFLNRFSPRAGLYFIFFLASIAALSPFLANEKPLMIELDNRYFFPAFTHQSFYILKNGNSYDTLNVKQTDWKQIQSPFILWAAVPYSPGKGDLLNANFVAPAADQKLQLSNGNIVSMPSRFRHWLGTSQRGDDLLAGLIEGTRIALIVGFLSMLVAFIIGVALGSVAGYFGDAAFKMTYAQLLVTVILIPLGWFYAFTVRSLSIKNAFSHSAWEGWFNILVSLLIFIFIIAAGIFIAKRISFPGFLKRTFPVPVDMLISRFTEIMISLPTFLVVLSIAAVSTPSVWNVVIIIGLTSWTSIARLARSEMLRVKMLPFIESAKSLGFKNRYIIFRHALPNILAPLLVNVVFGIANAILIESAISFLGLGVSPNEVTWGSLLSDGTIDIHAWWMIIFPGMMIFLTVTSLNLLGEGLQDAFNPSGNA